MIRHKLVLLICLLTGSFAALRAQQDPMYTMYMWNMMAVHPGYAGSADVLNATAVTRMQWSGLQGAPVTHSLSMHAPVRQGNFGAGLSVVDDRIGRMGNSSIFGDLAYRIRLSKGTRLSFGLKFGLNRAQFQNSLVEHTDPEDPIFAVDQAGTLLPNYGFGIYLWSARGYVGASIPKLRRNALLSSGGDNGNIGSMVEQPHLFVTAGYVIALGQVKLKPAMLIRAAENVPLNADLSANVLFLEKLWIGAAYRTAGSISAITSIQFNDQFRAGYAYDMGIGPVAYRRYASHEIMFSFDPIYNKKRMRSPRYF